MSAVAGHGGIRADPSRAAAEPVVSLRGVGRRFGDAVVLEGIDLDIGPGSVGQQRMLALHGGRTDRLEVSPGLWAGVGLVRGGAGTALVGSHEDVADRIAEYHELGIDEVVLSGYPHLEEAYRFGEGVAPVLRRRGLLGDRALAGAGAGAGAAA